MELDKNEENVFNQVKLKGSSGITKNMLKKNLNLAQGIITSCVKELIKEGMIREYKTKRNTVIYIASGFLPD